MNPTAAGPDHTDLDALDTGDEALPMFCLPSMTGWCGQLHRHDRCYFNHPDEIAAVRARTYGMWDGHQWVCSCPCYEIHNYPPCPHPDHHGTHQRLAAPVDHDIQQTLF